MTRRRLLRLVSAGGLALLAQPALPALSTTGAPAQRPLSPTDCAETASALDNLCAQVEALIAALYYQAITRPDGFFSQLPALFQNDLRAALDADWFHYRYLVDTHAAVAPVTQFYFPAGVFDAGNLVAFLGLMERLEQLAGSLYLVCVRRFGELELPARAVIAGQIAAIEAEHRIAGREIAQDSPPPPNDLCFERITVACVSDAQQLLRPFVIGDVEQTQSFDLPTPGAIDEAIDDILCTPVPIGGESTRIFLPAVFG
jgi:hypothetical protein